MPEDKKPAEPPMPNRNPALVGAAKGVVIRKVVPVGGVGAPDAPRRPEGEGRGR